MERAVDLAHVLKLEILYSHYYETNGGNAGLDIPKIIANLEECRARIIIFFGNLFLVVVLFEMRFFKTIYTRLFLLLLMIINISFFFSSFFLLS